MRIVRLTLMVACAALASCATLPDSQETRELLLSDAKARSAKFCSKSKEGCDLTIAPTKGNEWTVHVDLILRGKDGARVYGIGTDEYYFYNRYGQFAGSEAGY